MLKIGRLTLSSPFILAPMAGISDLPYRLINRNLGCELAFVSMISVRALVYQSKKTEKMLLTIPADRPLGIQLLGREPHFILKALEMVHKYKPDIIDFNAACPVSKVTSRGEGASLLKEPVKLGELLKILVEHSEIPVTVKIRTGWDESCVNARDVALYAQDAGIKGLFIHGRTKSQGYNGNADYKAIRDVKDVLEIPVIGSGDIFSAQSVRKMFDETGCDGVTIARGALGNPWIFREIAEFFGNGKIMQRPCLNDIADTMFLHLKLCVDTHGSAIGSMLFRKFFVWYTKGFPNMKYLREKAFCSKTGNQMADVIEEFRTLNLKVMSCKL